MTTAGSCTVIDGSDSPWDSRGVYKLYSKNEDGNVPGHYLHFDGSLLKADGDGENNANFKIHRAVDNQEETIVILEHEESHKVMAINTQNDKVTLEDPPVVLSQITEKDGSIDKSHPKILFHKKWWRPGSKCFCLKSLLDDYDDKKRFVGFDEKGMPMNTTKVKEGEFASLFETH